MKICSRCGQELTDDSLFCNKCGHKTEKDFRLNVDWDKNQNAIDRIPIPHAELENAYLAQESIADTETEKPQLSPVKIIIILACIVSVFGMYSIVTHNGKSPSNNIAITTSEAASPSSDKFISTTDSDVIKGSNSYDITLGLENSGIPRGVPENSKVDNGKYITSTANMDGAIYEYHMSTTQSDEVTFASFSIVCASDDKNLLNTSAAEYLGFCATMPYDGATPQDARDWVSENVPNATQAKAPIQASFCGVTFCLYGTGTSRWLEIKP